MVAPAPVALVTGGGRGIGAGIARRLAADRWRVIVVDRVRLVADLPDGCRLLPADVTDEADVDRVLDDVEGREGRLDGLVCNAGIMIRSPIRDLARAEFDRVLATNLPSTFLLARRTETLLRAARGAIVTIASTRARMSEPNTEAYAASKGGLVALTHALAVSLGPDVRVNCVSPGWIETRGEPLRPEDHAQHPAGRVGRVEDVAAMVAFLLGPESGFITGAEFVVDGGMTRTMIYRE